MNLTEYKLKNYFSNLAIIWLVILLYRISRYYSDFLRKETQITLLILALSYTIIAFIYYLLTPEQKISPSKGFLIFRFFEKISRKIYCYLRNILIIENFQKITKEEKTAILFVIVKIFFLPIMLNFFFGNFFSLKNHLPNLLNLNSLFTINNFNSVIFPFLLATIFLLDTLWFSFGYAFESGFLKNKIRSVEPTLIGWIVALACYPPFNSFITKYTNWYASDYVLFSTPALTFVIRIIIILLFLIYLGATFALAGKCSNLTNRGIVTKGPYAVIRHPAYISKNLAWWLTIIPVFSLPAFLSMAAWSFIYHLRTITEENHLKKDVEYQIYCRKVKYRYIPGIY